MEPVTDDIYGVYVISSGKRVSRRESGKMEQMNELDKAANEGNGFPSLGMK
jgi:hypothetical protein